MTTDTVTREYVPEPELPEYTGEVTYDHPAEIQVEKPVNPAPRPVIEPARPINVPADKSREIHVGAPEDPYV